MSFFLGCAEGQYRRVFNPLPHLGTGERPGSVFWGRGMYTQKGLLLLPHRGTWAGFLVCCGFVSCCLGVLFRGNVVDLDGFSAGW